MKKLTFLKSLLLAVGLLAGNIGAWAQSCDISDDFATLTASSSYASVTTTAGWQGTNTAVLQGGTGNSGYTFNFIGSDANTKALCINGKTTAVGIITSPTLTGGCASISFKYGHPFSESNGAKFTVEIKQNGTTVWSEQIVNTSMTQYTAYTYSKTGLSISGDFTVVITNNSPSASTSNKDRVAIWGICITNYSGGTPTPTPTITLTETSIPAFTTTVENPVTSTIHVSGVNLTDPIVLSISDDNDNQFSVDPASLTPEEGTVAKTDVTITYSPTLAGNHTATLTLTSTDATDITRSLSGTAGLATPVATAATDAAKTKFTAHWDPVAGAVQYELSVYTKDISEEATLLSEDFINFKDGGPGSQADSRDISGALDSLTLVPGWSGYKVYQAGETAKIGTSSVLGYLTTPALDLYLGEITLSFKAMAWSGDATDLKIYLDDILAYTQTGLNNDATYTLNSYFTTLTDGNTNSKIKFEGKQASNGRFFLDDVVVTKKSYKQLTGSPFTVTGTETSKEITGLSPATTYYYKVVAISGDVRSAASNEIEASTLSVGVPSVTLKNISVRDGKIYVTAPAAGQQIEVYNMLGQRIVSIQSVEGQNEISVPAKGIHVVKCGTTITTVILP